jgi:hypothetical protein
MTLSDFGADDDAGARTVGPDRDGDSFLPNVDLSCDGRRYQRSSVLFELGNRLSDLHGRGAESADRLIKLVNDFILLDKRRQRQAERSDIRHIDRLMRRSHHQAAEHRLHGPKDIVEEFRADRLAANPSDEILCRRHRNRQDRWKAD